MIKRQSNSGQGPNSAEAPDRNRRGPCPKAVVEFPAASTAGWTDPIHFDAALRLHMQRHGDTIWHLHRAVLQRGERFNRTTIREWHAGRKSPRSRLSLEVLSRIERRYRLPVGYFREKLSHPARASSGRAVIAGISSSERRRLSWHLPDDFDSRSCQEQDEIINWVRNVVLAGSTAYRQFQVTALQSPFGLRFPSLTGAKVSAGTERLVAPRQLALEMASLITFKTATLTPVGMRRVGVWNEETASQKIEHLGLFFGALAAPAKRPVNGYGVPLSSIGMGLLVFPAVWDWYLTWREQRRGFFTAWELNMLHLGLALGRRQTGWLRQNPQLMERLVPVPGLVSQPMIDIARTNWESACDQFVEFAASRSREVQRAARVHRDPFEPILPVLEAASPVAEYRKITEEILRLMPDADRHPRPAAEAVRSYLMLRLGLHLGVRQKNLRQLLVCGRDASHTPESVLSARKVGELRWHPGHHGWEVLIPSSAFKNSGSSFFGGRPFRLLLPDLGGLYGQIEQWVRRHRPVLLAGARDPRTFFVKSVKANSGTAAYSQAGFYDAWRLTIQRYGIHNPWTMRGAISGLLPHGPHNVRDVLATHVLKHTGSYEQAGYAIQDTPEVVAKHYGRFLPRDKSALAAAILNQAWLD